MLKLHTCSLQGQCFLIFIAYKCCCPTQQMSVQHSSSSFCEICCLRQCCSCVIQNFFKEVGENSSIVCQIGAFGFELVLGSDHTGLFQFFACGYGNSFKCPKLFSANIFNNNDQNQQLFPGDFIPQINLTLSVSPL